MITLHRAFAGASLAALALGLGGPASAADGAGFDASTIVVTAARVAAITWRGLLPGDRFDGFGLMLKLPGGRIGPLCLPVRQTCGKENVEWSQIPAAGQTRRALKRPAPVIELKPAEMSHMH